jgi:hypothetical protein
LGVLPFQFGQKLLVLDFGSSHRQLHHLLPQDI